VEKQKLQDVPAGAGGREYIWERPRATLDVTTNYRTDEKTGKEIETATFSVDVRGDKPSGQIGTTGAGLSLGDPTSKVAKVYGSRFFRHTLPNGSLRISIQWKDETMLTIYFDGGRRINRMILEASIE
jgi:hypothetical protein